MENPEPRLNLADFATDLDAIPSELDKLKRLATACEQQRDAVEILKRYLEACDLFSRMHENFTTDETWLAGLEQAASIQVIRGTLGETRESMLRSIAAVECRLVAAGALAYPGQA
jgi:hypothetical protein